MILPDFPLRIEFEVTSKCNLNCTYCYAMPFTNINPPVENLEYLFKKTKKEADPFEIVIVGGEPFIRKDIITVIELADSIFQRDVEVSTNGTLIGRLTEEEFERLKFISNRHTSIQVSLDSIDDKINSITRGKTEATLQGIKALDSHGVSFSVGIVLTKANIDHVKPTAEHLLKTYKNLKVINLEPLQSTLAMGSHYYNLRLDSGKMIELFEDITELSANLNRKDVRLTGVVRDYDIPGKNVKTMIDDYGFKSCTAGILRAAVFVEGTVTPCGLLRTASLGNLYKNSWKEIWDVSKERFRNLNETGSQCRSNLSVNNRETIFVDIKNLVRKSYDSNKALVKAK